MIGIMLSRCRTQFSATCAGDRPSSSAIFCTPALISARLHKQLENVTTRFFIRAPAQSSPNVMVPRHNSETRSPLLPNNLYCIVNSRLRLFLADQSAATSRSEERRVGKEV